MSGLRYLNHAAPLLLVCILLLGGVAYAGEYYVDPATGSDSNSGLSEGQAWKTLTHALLTVTPYATDPTILHASPGTYSASGNGETFPIELGSYTTLTGAGTTATVIDGEQAAVHVIKCLEADDVTIQGLTLRGGDASGMGSDAKGGGLLVVACTDLTVSDCAVLSNNAWSGGGVYVGSSSADISDCLVAYNTTAFDFQNTSWGGGMCIDESSCTVTDCTVHSNEAWAGGGICCQLCSPTIQDCTIFANSGTPDSDDQSWGGGVCCDQAPAHISGCSITMNSAWAGAGLHCQVESPLIENCTFDRNICTPDWRGSSFGGGLSSEGAAVRITGCSFSENEAQVGGGVRCSWDTSPIVDDCQFTGNVAVPDDEGDSWGGGLFANNSYPTIKNCDFTANSANSGAGMYAETCAGIVEGCTFSECEGIPDASGNSRAGGVGCNLSPICLFNCTVSDNSAASGAGLRISGTPSPTILNCQITDNTGVAASDGDSWGGGITCNDSSPTVADCSISRNSSTQGGGIHCSNGASPRVLDCNIVDNVAPLNSDGNSWGGGLHSVKSSPTLSGCYIKGNAASKGAGVRCTNGSPALDDCEIDSNVGTPDNYGVSQGGGVSCDESEASLFNCTVTRNNSLVGGGIHSVGSHVSMNNCTLALNYATTGGGLRSEDAPYPEVSNSILWDNDEEVSLGPGSDALISFSCVAGGYTGAGNFADDPELVAASMGGYYLSCTAAGQAVDSPCIDVGTDTASNMGLSNYTTRTDHEPDTGVVDVGCHYRLPASEPKMECFLNSDWFIAQSKLEIWATLENEAAQTTCDVYLAFIMPNGAIFCITPSGLSDQILPFVSNVTMPQDFAFGPSLIFETTIPDGIEDNGYALACALSMPGGLQIIGDIGMVDFSIEY